MPDNFCNTPEGVVFITNGIDKPLRFDPAVGATQNAGIVAPTAPLTVSGLGNGSILGSFQAYARFVDRDGYFSSLTPVSNTFEAVSTTGTVSAASNASPIVITTSAVHGLGTGQQVRIKDVMGNTAANGTWKVVFVSTTTFKLYYLDGSTPSVGNGVYNSGGSVETGRSQLQFSNVPVSTEARVVRRQVLRNRDGSFATFYVDIDTTDLTSTSLTSLATSDSLISAVPLEDDTGHSLVDKTVPPNTAKYAAMHLGRMFMAGVEPYSEGAVAVTNGSLVVTGIGTEWGMLTFPGRFLEVVGGNKTYTIAAVLSTTSLQLTEAYSGTTDAFAYYMIHPGDGERRSIRYSEPNQPESFPGDNQLTLEADPGAGDITGILAMRSWLYPLAENRVYRFSYVNNPLLDGFNTRASKRGCVNQRCAVVVEDVAYMMDTLGFHAFAGNDDQDIGDPQVSDLFRNRPSGPYRINWTAKRYFHAVYDPGEMTIRWFVSLSGNYTPQHALCFNIRNKRWWPEEFAFPIASSCLGRLNGKPQVFLGTNGKRILASGGTNTDGVYPAAGTLRGTVTSSGVTWIADTAATFPSSNVAGNQVQIIGGKGKGQKRTIVSISGTTINVSEPWLDRPDTNSTYQIGGIPWRWKSGWYRWADSEHNTDRTLSVQQKPTSAAAQMYARLYQDLGTTAESWAVPRTTAEGNGIALVQADFDADLKTDLTIDPTKGNGWVQQKFDNLRIQYADGPRFVAVELAGCTNDDRIIVNSIGLEGAG